MFDSNHVKTTSFTKPEGVYHHGVQTSSTSLTFQMVGASPLTPCNLVPTQTFFKFQKFSIVVDPQPN
jgi:hypothetical protein